MGFNSGFKGLNAELNPICHLLALLGAHPILHISRIRVNLMNVGGFRTESTTRLKRDFVLCRFSPGLGLKA